MTDLVLNDELKLLKESAHTFIQKESPIEALRKLRDEQDETGFSRELWQKMVEMGWVGMTIPEEYDGLAYEYQGWGPILEEMGRTLTAAPFLSTIVLGSTAIQLGGTDEQKSEILPAVAAGEQLLTLALEEGRHHAPAQTAMQADKTDDGYRINGKKVFVLDGHVADTFIVAARTSGQAGDESGISLFIVDANTKGVQTQRTVMVDSRNAAQVTFTDVAVPAKGLLGQEDEGLALLERVLDIGRISLAAEMLGLAQEAFERTVNYLKTRKQFGVYIGSFQALQHRASEMFCELELSKSVVLKALIAIDEGAENLPQLASLAKYTLGETTRMIARESIQMFGGIGMTDEEEIGFFLKRAIAAEKTFGDHAFHLERFASLSGY